MAKHFIITLIVGKVEKTKYPLEDRPRTISKS